MAPNSSNLQIPPCSTHLTYITIIDTDTESSLPKSVSQSLCCLVRIMETKTRILTQSLCCLVRIMETKTRILLLVSIFLFKFLYVCFATTGRETYIVQLHPHGFVASSFASKLHWHLAFLDRVVSSEGEAASSSSRGRFSEGEAASSSSRGRFLYSYRTAMEGFAALLSESEVETMKRMSDVIAVRPDRKLRVHTTYSPAFMGLSLKGDGAWYDAGFGHGTIIGVLDTGVWPESPSFHDRGMPPVPKKWRGICQQGQSFNASDCNKKLIGARFFHKGHRVASASLPVPVKEYVSPRDSLGHGTHTSSTAGGASVMDASVLGNGAGVARGMAPGAHIAVYKVCWINGCYSSDILAAMDVAIRDGVDVLSLSLGGFPLPLYEDNIAIGSFRATQHGVSVVCAAGNNGPIQSSVANEAPWIATVGASTLDRKFPALVQMGNGETLYGESMYPGKHVLSAERELELVYLASGEKSSQYCLAGSLPRSKVRGKMVVCDRGVNGRAEKGQIVKEAGGAAMVLANTEVNLEEVSVDPHVLPATLVGFSASVRLKSYINSTRRPVARIVFAGTVIGKSRAPVVARFSSRGPSIYNPTVLKPDVIAPGVNIIAAWPQNMGPTGLPGDHRKGNFTVMSGTSMACPHVSGIIALIRSAHPNWTPAAVKSALMTTADVTDHAGKSPIMDGYKPAKLFAMGAGHVNPVKAINPGLIYDIKPADYIPHLCKLGYTASEIFAISHKNISCHKTMQNNKGFSLNYPSVSVIFRHGKTRKVFKRRVTNVGNPNSTYSLELKAPPGVRIRVKPRKLVFRHVNQILSYRIWFISRKKIRTVQQTSFAEGHLTWVQSGKGFNNVRSPISVTWV